MEAELSTEYGVSRPIVREAIKVLADKGLVRPLVRVGTRVQPKERWRWLDPKVMDWSARGATDREMLRELTDVRRIIEPGAARLAAIRATDEERQELRDAFALMQRAAGDEPEAYVEADLRFHFAILASCHSVLLLQLTHAIDAALRASREVTVVRGHRESLEDHEQVLVAILAGQPAAAEAAMAALIDQAARDIELVFAREAP